MHLPRENKEMHLEQKKWKTLFLSRLELEYKAATLSIKPSNCCGSKWHIHWLMLMGWWAVLLVELVYLYNSYQIATKIIKEIILLCSNCFNTRMYPPGIWGPIKADIVIIRSIEGSVQHKWVELARFPRCIE